MPARSVDQLNINNWQATGSDVPVPQYQFDLEIKWTSLAGVQHEHSDTYRWPNVLSSMPLNVVRRFMEEMITATARVTLEIDEWDDYV